MRTVITRAEAAGMDLAELRRRRRELLDAIPDRAEMEGRTFDQLTRTKLSIEVQKMILEAAEARARRWPIDMRAPPIWVSVAAVWVFAAIAWLVVLWP